ncbi:hypothetical protein DZC72_10735 [Maribacter algicola]|uniref:Uncharacterized protein n=1 Tax=Maribacter algicola TaxID=2498892 RepID=A0A3R8Q228_9FLAO|nr:hypothetical protein [Maribacter algicola]RRQ48192.1 hypothetical protein DZC72_10735 [Maribacter algicola]
MRKIPIIVLCSLLFSCVLFLENGIDVKIINNSKEDISNIVVKTSENTDSLIFELLRPKESITGFLIIENAKTDGSYVLIYNKADGETIETVGGYYSNGISFLDLMRIDIQQDTTLIYFEENP